MSLFELHDIPGIIYGYLENHDLIKIAKILKRLSLPLSQIKLDMWICDLRYGEYLIKLFKNEKKECLKLRMSPFFSSRKISKICSHVVELRLIGNHVSDKELKKLEN